MSGPTVGGGRDLELEKLFAESQPQQEGPDVIFDEQALIPPGKYEFELVAHRCATTRWGPKIFLTFRVREGDCKGMELSRFYNATKIDTKGRPQVASAGDFKKEMRILFPGRSLRIFAWKWFRDITVAATVVDVGQGGERYSKIGKLIGSRSL